MNKPVTVRLPAQLLGEIGRLARREGTNKGTMVRELMEEAVHARRTAAVLKDYREGRLSEGEACRELRLDRWDFLTLLSERNLDRNVALEDALNARSLSAGRPGDRYR
ncbi:MAG: hypothetical protein A3G34_01460 [Candidatus Lindowbacteria bacterium RIFCSPLOWO2_12_FULL_62_27]|nr:MAG: hypothetical protein A3G34_01460 [Candidatus Lindowbacteria bacterium RIFCSPLOWO2_12_FULL_62_27]OGH61919.1 MAG: hypothetical protein A3I06_03475 [Candidatus Lindowbacteria bacterium RIFCSPLOWO2_02_FULL_62_12]